MSIKANPIFARLITAKKITARLIQTFSKICRYFSTFDGSSSYAALTDEIVLSGDFEIEFKTINSDLSSGAYFLADINGINGRILYLNTGNIVLTGDTDETYVNVGQLSGVANRVFALKRVNGVYSVDINGNISTNPTVNISSVTINSMASQWGSATGVPFFSGQMHDLKIWSGGDRNTGSLILDLPMDEGLKDVYDEVFYRNRVQAQAEWLLNLNGGYSSHQRLWNPDATDPSFSLEAYFDVSVGGTIVSQNVSGTASQRELQIYTQSSGLFLYLGGSLYSITGLTGAALFRVDFDGSNYTLFKNGTQIGSVSATIGTGRQPTADFRIGARNNGSGGAGYTYNGTIKGLKFWVNGTKSTGDLVLDTALDDNSNIIANAASPVNANVWDDSSILLIGESYRVDDNTYRILSTTGGYTELNSSTNVVSGLDVLIVVELVDGSLDNIIAGDSSVQYSGWVNVRDSNGQPTNKYKTIMNRPSGSVMFKRAGIVDATLTNITARVVEGYGVLQGTRGTDYEWKNETPHAIGYNVETNEVCTTDGTNWIDADLWIDGDPFID